MRLAVQPDLTDLYMPAAGVAHNIAVAGFTPRYPGHVRQAVSALWGAGQMTFNKYLLMIPLRHGSAQCPYGGGTVAPCRSLPGPHSGRGGARCTGPCGRRHRLWGQDGFRSDRCTPDVPLWPLPDRVVAAGGIGAWSLVWLAEWGVVALFAEPDAAVDVGEFLRRNALHPQALVLSMRRRRGSRAKSCCGWQRAIPMPGATWRSARGGLVADARTKLPGRPGYPSTSQMWSRPTRQPWTRWTAVE